MHTICAVIVPAVSVCWLLLSFIGYIDCTVIACLFELKQLALFLWFIWEVSLTLCFNPCLIVLCIMFIKWPWMQPVEVYVDDESKLTLHGLVQHYTMLTEDQKNKRLMDLLDQLDFNQVPFSSSELHCMSTHVAPRVLDFSARRQQWSNILKHAAQRCYARVY